MNAWELVFQHDMAVSLILSKREMYSQRLVIYDLMKQQLLFLYYLCVPICVWVC